MIMRMVSMALSQLSTALNLGNIDDLGGLLVEVWLSPFTQYG